MAVLPEDAENKSLLHAFKVLDLGEQYNERPLQGTLATIGGQAGA